MGKLYLFYLVGRRYRSVAAGAAYQLQPCSAANVDSVIWRAKGRQVQNISAACFLCLHCLDIGGILFSDCLSVYGFAAWAEAYSDQLVSYWCLLVCDRATACPMVKVSGEWGEASECDKGDKCSYCHTRMELQFHPDVSSTLKAFICIG